MFYSCEDTKKIINERNAYFIDVRTPGEFEMDQLPGAINIPLDVLEAQVEAEVSKDRPVVVFCRSGARSGMAQQIMQNMGYPEVYNMGPSTAWHMC